jgi:hypothetical protein
MVGGLTFLAALERGDAMLQFVDVASDFPGSSRDVVVGVGGGEGPGC